MTKQDKPEIRISLVTSMDTTTWAFGKRVLETLCEIDARLLPERVGNSEPIKTHVDDIAACERYWAPDGVVSGPDGASNFNWDFLWRRTKAIKCLGHVIHTGRNKFGKLLPGWLTLTSTPDKRPDWARLFRSLCTLSQPKFATLHLRTDTETRPSAFGPENDANFAFDDFMTGCPNIVLERRGLANLAWATFFGEEYAAEVNVQKLRDHGFSVEAIGTGILVILSPKLFDVMDDFASFSARRVMAKQLFKPGLFRIAEEPRIN